MAEVMVHADSQTEKKDKHLTKKDLWKVFWYSMGIESGCSVTKQEAPGFTQAMIPVVEKVCDPAVSDRGPRCTVLRGRCGCYGRAPGYRKRH